MVWHSNVLRDDLVIRIEGCLELMFVFAGVDMGQGHDQCIVCFWCSKQTTRKNGQVPGLNSEILNNSKTTKTTKWFLEGSAREFLREGNNPE